ncbi:MAG TPA: YobA family protein [Bacillus sp. (in: firmicutes)]|nr:YobA family protein [Bacillus sp. (in: firmicutes)]
MKKIISVTLFSFLSILLVGCNGVPDIKGYVVKREKERILVVSDKAEDYSSTGGQKESYDAVWVSDSPKDIKLGQRVQVWFSGPVMTSYPAKAGAKKVSIVKSKKPDGADLSETQALRKALLNKKNDENEVIVVKRIKYDTKLDNWTIRLRETLKTPGEPEEFDLQVKDK